MTGHGRGEGRGSTHHVTAEASSVNRKQAEIVISLPRNLDALEPRVRELAAQQVSRGRVSIKITLSTPEGSLPQRPSINRALARAYVDDLRALATELQMDPTISLDSLVRLPGVFESAEAADETESIWPPLKQAVESALAGLVDMREREGAALARDLDSRIQTMRATVAEIRAQAPEVLRRFQQQLTEKLQTAGATVRTPEDDRLLKEIVFFADRTDIAEELARLESHFQQFNDCLKTRESVGRTLDFLAQEMNREINTIGSKANDSIISRNVVVLKTELERFREQAQNVE